MNIAHYIDANSHRPLRTLIVIGLAFGLAGCNGPSQPAANPTPPAVPNPVGSTASPTSRPAAPAGDEAILILAPGPGSKLVSPIHVTGEADPTFEQTLGVRLLADDGAELASLTTTIQADAGQRGPFEVDIPFDPSQPRQAFIQVFAISARDGGVTHLAAVGVQLAGDGPAEIQAAEAHPEQISILEPGPGAAVSGGSLHVAGYGWAGFEQTLVIDVFDQMGNKIGEQPVIVQAPDMGQPGPFEADVPYRLGQAGPARVAVRDVSPAFGGDVHVTSVEINLQP